MPRSWRCWQPVRCRIKRKGNSGAGDQELTTLADYFVIATGSSNTQINALVDNVEKVPLEEAEEDPPHREGYRGGTWVLLDYGCIAVHVFNAEAREFYWAGAPVA